MNLKYLKIFWVIIQDDKYIIDELYLNDVLNIVDYVEEGDLKTMFTTRAEAEEYLKIKNKVEE